VSITIYISLFLSVMLSGLSVLAFRINNRNLKLVLAFSGAYLFAISVMHLIPELYQGGTKNVGLFILIGFFLQILLEFLSEGIEHGHVHIHKHGEHAFPLAMMIGLSVHSFLEAMPLANSYSGHAHDHAGHDHAHTGSSLLLGIILHNIPIAIALMTMLLESHIKRSKAIIMLTIFALTAPAGALVSTIIGDHVASINTYSDYIMAVVIGIFLHISTTILFESNENHRFNFIKFITIILGAGVAVLLN
jgi:zinc and cadmium transporter